MSVADPQALRAAAARSIRHPLTRALLLLTATAGVVDAVSFLGLGHVFTANMTGNIVLLGFGIAGTGGLPVLAPLISLAAFVLGSRTGGTLAAKLADRHPEIVAAPVAIEVGLLAAVAVVAAASEPHPGRLSADVMIALLAFAMGTRNAAVRRIGVPDLSTTVLTMTITGLAADTSLRRPIAPASIRRSSAVLAMLAGAIAGALLIKTRLWPALVLAATLSLITLITYVRTARYT